MKRLIIGKTSSGDPLVLKDAANSHAYISGSSGTDKSYAMRKLIRQLPDLGVRCIVLDASNDWTGLASSPANAGKETLAAEIIDVKDSSFAINPLHPLKISDKFTEDWNDVAFRLADIMKVAYKLKDIQSVYLMTAVHEFAHTKKYPKTI